jgi:phage terminase large subunit
MNEANNMTFHIYTELSSRTKGAVTLDWNPTNKFWFHDELKGDDDVDFIILNYKDNEGCPQSAIDFILKAKHKAVTSSFWDNWYQVYGLGLIGNLEGVVFNDWIQIDRVPIDARLLGYGMDFGYTNDPTTMIACYKYNDKYIFDECIYQKGLVNSEIANLIKQNKSSYIYADSAEPKSIAEIKRYGISIKGADKGKGSILYGISLLQEKEFMVSKRSVNMIKELRNYRWAIDKEGNATNKPIDAWNHCIDAVRYISVMLFKNKRKHTRAVV